MVDLAGIGRLGVFTPTGKAMLTPVFRRPASSELSATATFNDRDGEVHHGRRR
jgi:hypothetical protein